MSEKTVLKEYCDFMDNLKLTIKRLQKRIDKECHELGCKTTTRLFMECNKGCPLFYAWSYLDTLQEALETEKKNSKEDCFCPFAKEHCTGGKVESRPNDECEFWDVDKRDCRIRRVLTLLQLSLKLEEGHLTGSPKSC